MRLDASTSSVSPARARCRPERLVLAARGIHGSLSAARAGPLPRTRVSPRDAATIDAMVMTYGEEMLAEAELRVRGQSAKRRRARLLVPFLVAALWATADLMAARNGRLTGAGGVRLFFDHVLVL